MTIQRALKLFFCIPVVLQVLLLCSILFCLSSLEKEIDRQIEFKHLQSVLDNFQRSQTESLATAFCANATGYDRLKLQNKTSIAEMERLIPILRAEFASRPDLATSIDEIVRSEKQLMKFQMVLEKVSLPQLFVSNSASITMAVLVKGSLGAVRQLITKLEDTAVVNNAGWSKQWFVAIVATIGVFAFELALAINWSSRIFVGRLKSVFERIAEFERGEIVSTAVPPAVVTDEFAQVEASVLKANYEIAQLEESRRELSSIVAHDIRTPLTSIAGSLELLEQGVFGELPAQSRPEFENVRQVSNNLTFAANLLLQFSKPEHSSASKLESSARIEDSIYEALEQFGLEGLNDFSCIVEAEELRLPDAVGKLVAFVIKAMGQPDGVNVTTNRHRDCGVVKVSFPRKDQEELDEFQKLQQESSLKMVAIMLGVDNARLSQTTTSTYDIEFSFPQEKFKTTDLKNDPEVTPQNGKGKGLDVTTNQTKRQTPRSFHQTLVTLLIATISVNLVTVSALAYVWQRGQSQLSSEIESRNAIYRASVVTANVSEVVLASIFNIPHLERYRHFAQIEIDKSFKRLSNRELNITPDHLLTWKNNVETILALSKDIASVPREEMPTKVKELIDNHQIDVLITKNKGRLLVADEQAATDYSKRLLKLFEQVRIQIICISIVGACASIGAAMLLSRYLIARLEHVKNNANALIAKRELSPPLFGSDDIASLDRFFYEAASRIEALERNKMQLSSLLRDDLSTLIAQMRSKLEAVMATAEVPAKAREQLDTVHSALARLSILVEDLECSNALGTGAKEALQIKLASTSLSAVVSDTIGATAYQAKLKNVGIEVSRQCAEEIRIIADQRRLVQVLVNLLTNAIKASSPGSAVTIETIVEDNKATITIVDCGKGIEPKVMDKLFQRFSTTDTSQGVGLGLYISKFLIDVQGGEIGVNSQPLKGSRFWVKFPIAGIELDGP